MHDVPALARQAFSAPIRGGARSPARSPPCRRVRGRTRRRGTSPEHLRVPTSRSSSRRTASSRAPRRRPRRSCWRGWDRRPLRRLVGQAGPPKTLVPVAASARGSETRRSRSSGSGTRNEAFEEGRRCAAGRPHRLPQRTRTWSACSRRLLSCNPRCTRATASRGWRRWRADASRRPPTGICPRWSAMPGCYRSDAIGGRQGRGRAPAGDDAQRRCARRDSIGFVPLGSVSPPRRSPPTVERRPEPRPHGGQLLRRRGPSPDPVS